MKKDRQSMQTLAALVLLAAFAITLLASLLAGARAYRRLAQRGQQAYESRTALGYLTARVSQAENVAVEPFAGGDALCVYQQMEAETYVTRIYCYQGWLMELFTVQGASFSPEDGERVVPMERLELTLEGGLLTLDATWEAARERFCLHLPEVGL